MTRREYDELHHDSHEYNTVRDDIEGITKDNTDPEWYALLEKISANRPLKRGCDDSWYK